MQDFIKAEERTNLVNLIDTYDMENQGDYQEYDLINQKIIEYMNKINNYITANNKPWFIPLIIFRAWKSNELYWYRKYLSELYDKKTKLIPRIMSQYSRRIYGG